MADTLCDLLAKAKAAAEKAGKPTTAIEIAMSEAGCNGFSTQDEGDEIGPGNTPPAPPPTPPSPPGG